MKKQAFGLVELAIVFLIIIVVIILGLKSDLAVVKNAVSEKSMLDKRKDLLNEKLQNIEHAKKMYDSTLERQQQEQAINNE